MTGPSAEDVIAEAIHRSDCGCSDWHADDQEDATYREHAAAVVAAIRGMGVEQQAELIGGCVETSPLIRGGSRYRCAVGPWRAEP